MKNLTSEATGGYVVGHIVDGTIALAKELIMSQYAAKIYEKPIGEVIRLFRIDGCRLWAHVTKTHFLEITNTCILKIGKPLTSNE